MKSDKPLIYLITSGELTSQNYSANSQKLLQIIETAIFAGVSMVQIREKQLPARLLFKLTQAVIKIRHKSQTKVLVNERVDVAFAAQADGVHLPSNSISTKIIRSISPPGFIVGVSTHNLDEVLDAKTNGANFAVFSPIFFTQSKAKYGQPQGVEKLIEVVNAVNNFPVIALGGINEENFEEVLNAGANGIAAIKLLNEIDKISDIIKKIQTFKRKNEQE